MSADTHLDLRNEVKSWLAERWTADRVRAEFLEEVVDDRWAVPTWPEADLGRGLDSDAAGVIVEEFRRVRAPGSGQDRTNLWAGTVAAYGSQELKDKFVRELLLDRVDMCLLYSEPGAGSDLAGLQTRAERDGDEWVITGQKVWTSGARQADWAMLIARTDWNVAKHSGIGFFWFPMKQDGVDVRPLRQATGDARFNEVFLTEARVPHSHLLGTPTDGWRVLQTALQYERAAMGGAASGRRREPAAADRAPDSEASAPPPDVSLVELARSTGRSSDSTIRQGLAQLHMHVTVNRWNNERARAALAEGNSSPLASLGKLYMSHILHSAGSLQAEILGAEAMIGGNDSPRAADATYSLLNAFFTSIGGGTDQIQRNIIGERILGLPKEPEMHKNLPFKDVPKPGIAIDT